MFKRLLVTILTILTFSTIVGCSTLTTNAATDYWPRELVSAEQLSSDTLTQNGGATRDIRSTSKQVQSGVGTLLSNAGFQQTQGRESSSSATTYWKNDTKKLNVEVTTHEAQITLGKKSKKSVGNGSVAEPTNVTLTIKVTKQ